MILLSRSEARSVAIRDAGGLITEASRSLGDLEFLSDEHIGLGCILVRLLYGRPHGVRVLSPAEVLTIRKSAEATEVPQVLKRGKCRQCGLEEGEWVAIHGHADGRWVQHPATNGTFACPQYVTTQYGPSFEIGEFADSTLVLMPISDGGSVTDEGAHWTLLVLRRASIDDTWEALYFDSVVPEFKRTRDIARQLLTFLSGLGQRTARIPTVLPSRSDKIGTQCDQWNCGIFVLYAMEVMIAHSLGQEEVLFVSAAARRERLQGFLKLMFENAPRGS